MNKSVNNSLYELDSAFVNIKINFNDGWYFKRLDNGIYKNENYIGSVLFDREKSADRCCDCTEAEIDLLLPEQVYKDAEGYGSVPWLPVTLPHTARLEALVTGKSGEDGDCNQQWQGICWYFKKFNLPEELANKKVFIHFEGAMNVADVWVNGKHVGRHMGGYLPFTLDIGDSLMFGFDNVIAVRLDNNDNAITGPKPLKALDFNMYHGLYRNVFLIIKDRLHITDPLLADKPASGGVFITFPKVSEKLAEVQVKTHIMNEHDDDKVFIIRTEIIDDDGAIVASQVSGEIYISAGCDAEVIQNLTVENPKLWDIYNPHLYHVKVGMFCGNKVVDEETIRTGIRHIYITEDGFWLNGKKLYLRGANRHQEYPYIGYALSDSAQYRDAKRIKEAGFDYIRLSHYPHSPAFMDACDELGLMVMNCIPGWQFFGGEEFQQLQYKNCRDMIRRDRNHPCVLLWEVSLNETRMTQEFIKETHRIAHEEYPGDQCYTCGWMEGYDVFGQARQHGGCHKVAGRPCVVTEYGDWEYYAQNAGFNQEKWEDLKSFERNSRQLRGDGEIRLLQQALNYQEAHNDNRSTKAFADSIWVMYDYNRGYAPDLEASGIMDIMRIPKFSYYFFQSQRDPDIILPNARSGPMVYIANYWTEKSPLDVRIYSNCEEVALYLNGRLVEKRRPDNDRLSTHLAHPPFTFKLNKFEEGELCAVGYINKMECARFVRRTPGRPEKLEVFFEEGPLAVNGKDDIIFVYACLQDGNGTIVHDAVNTVRFAVTGPARLIGQNPIRAEAGIAAILLNIYQNGEKRSAGDIIEVKAESEGLISSSASIELGK